MAVLISQRNSAIDIIRIVATLMIVVAHVVVTVYERPDFYGGSAWLLSFVTITLCRLGVPLFFLISGYLLVEKERSFSQNILHTWKRLLFPCLVWSVITYIGFYISQHKLVAFTGDLLFTSAGTAYYFLIGLAIIYLLNPVIQAITKAASRQQLQLFLLVLAVTTIGHTTYSYLYQQPGFTVFTYWFLCLFYFVYGQYYFHHKGYVQKLSNWLNLGLFAMPFMINLAAIYLLRTDGVTQDLLFESYLGPTVLLSSIGLFNLVMKLSFSWVQKPVRTLLVTLANASFGVYLIHGIVLDLLLHRTALTPYGIVTINLLAFLSIATAITVLVSFLASAYIGRTKYLQATVGVL